MATFPQSDVAVNGITVDALPSKVPGSQVQRIALDPFGNVRFAQGLPGKAGIVRLGYSFVKSSDSVVAVNAVPTTTASHLFINSNSTRSVIIDRISWQQDTAKDTAGGVSLLAAINNAAVTSQTATADTLTAIYSLNGGVVNAGAVSQVVSSHGCATSSTAGSYFALGQAGDHATATDEGLAIICNLDGLIILAPQRAIALCAYAADATIAGTVSMFWHEQVI